MNALGFLEKEQSFIIQTDDHAFCDNKSHQDFLQKLKNLRLNKQNQKTKVIFHSLLFHSAHWSPPLFFLSFYFVYVSCPTVVNIQGERSKHACRYNEISLVTTLGLFRFIVLYLWILESRTIYLTALASILEYLDLKSKKQKNRNNTSN